MLDELVPQTVVLDGTGVGVWKGDVRAGNIITMSPGFSTAPGAVFHAYISPLQTSNILSASKTQNRKPNNYNNNKINDFSNTINEKNITEIEYYTVSPAVDPNVIPYFEVIKKGCARAGIHFREHILP
jgi:hypothetical protein